MSSSDVDLSGRTLLITGATNGIGRVAARELARRGGNIVLVARSRERGEATVDEIVRATGSRTVELMIADLSSLEQVRKLADEYLASGRPLHVLLNNAGAVFTSRAVSVDGFEKTFALNHLAYFLLTNLLRGRLEESGHARVVSVASDAARFAGGRLNFDDLQLENGYSGMKAYGASKLANILFTRELARRLADTDVTANAVHPGMVASGFGKNNGWFAKIAMTLVTPVARSPEKGAETSIYLCGSAEVEGVTGEYFFNKKRKEPLEAARNDDDARRLWEVSVEMTGLEA